MVRIRLRRLRRVMHEHGLDGLVVSSLPNIRYLTGFSGSHALCVITPRRALFISDPRYDRQSRTEVSGWRRLIAPAGLFDAASRIGALRGCRRVGFETHELTYMRYRTLRRLFPSVSFRPAVELVENLALVKDAAELRNLRAAVRISDRVFDEVVKMIRPGVRELDVAAEITYLQRKLGAERDAFDPLVASGRRSALPHARASTKRIRNGDLVVLDFGCTVAGYCSDLTRTVGIGHLPPRAREMYRVVAEAQAAAVAAVKGDMLARDLDAVVRARITRAGYGSYFVHALGHGLGLHIHERPRVSQLSTERLLAGSVITIEPGVYLPDIGGVRIEDDVLVTARGCRVLNSAPRELMIL